jgi:hypothetical protein
MKIDQIETTMKTALMERSKLRSCHINDSTGNLLSYNNKKYIITCRHVADDFFNKKRPYVLLRDNKRIYTENLIYQSCTNKELDIAVIEIIKQDQINYFYTKDDFEIIDDFSQILNNNISYFIFGYPFQLKYEEDGKDFILWMSYLTVKNKTVSSTQDFIFLDYQRESEKNIIVEKGLKTILPKAHGLSGAFIFKIEQFKEDNITLWSPSFAKIIAIQMGWNKKSWLKGSNTKHLFELLNKANIT